VYVAPPASTGLRWAVYAAALTVVALAGYRVTSAPKTPYQELKARVDTGWEGTYFEGSAFPAPEPPAAREDRVVPGDAVCRIRGGDSRTESDVSPSNPLVTFVLLAFVLLGLAGWLGAVLTKWRPARRRRAPPLGGARA
jgi:hypothetical protein